MYDLLLLEILLMLLGPRRRADDGLHLEESPIPQNVAFRRALGGCPACEGGLKEHRYAFLASTRFDDDDQTDQVLWDLLSEQDWELVKQFEGGSSGEILMQAYAFRCPQRRRSGWFTVFFPVDETDLPFVSRVQSLGRDDSEGLVSSFNQIIWKQFV